MTNDYPTTGRRLMIFDILVVVSTTTPAKLDRRRNLTKCQMVPIDSMEAAAKVIYTKYSKHSNETNTFMGLGRAGRFGQS